MSWTIRRVDITCPVCRILGTVALNAWKHHGKRKCQKCGYMINRSDTREEMKVYRGYRSIKIVPMEGK